MLQTPREEPAPRHPHPVPVHREPLHHGLVVPPRPLAQVRLGKGNGTGDGTEGAYNDTVFGTYMHGPVLARNPQIADLLLKLALDVNALPPTDDRWFEALRDERISAAQQPA